MKTSILLAAILSATLSAPIASAQEISTPAKPAMSMDMDKQMPQMQEHMQKGTGGSADMKRPMMTGMDSMQKMPMSGDTDKDFAIMMKIHHQQAVAEKRDRQIRSVARQAEVTPPAAGYPAPP